MEEELTPAERDERLKLIEQIGRAFLKAPSRYATTTVLGHSDIKHTTVYLHLSQRHLHAVANPLDSLPVSDAAAAKRPRRKPAK